MPNHFHLILKELRSGGISLLMQRVGNSYTKYFNAKHERSGHLFSSRFQSIHIDKNEYLTRLSGYIHLTNPRELSQWQGKEIQYPWASLQDFLIANRWEQFLSPAIILNQFNGKEEYKTFLEENYAESVLDNRYLIDCQ
jgi:putative transposase